MRRIITSLFIMSLVLLTACFGGNGDNAKEITYDGQLLKLQKDIIEYQTSTKRAEAAEFKMYGEGIYVNILAEDNIEGYEGWYFYSLDVVGATEGDQMKELVKLVSVAGPKDNVHTVFGDNAVGLFEYKGIADTKENGTPFETVLAADVVVNVVDEDGETEEVVAGEIVPEEQKKASVTSELTYDVTNSAITFTYKDNLVTEAAVTIKDGEKVVAEGTIEAKDGNATVAAIVLPGKIGVEAEYTVSSKDIIFGENNVVTVDAKDYPVVKKAEASDDKTVVLTLNDEFTLEELEEQEVTLAIDDENSTAAAIVAVVSAVNGKEVTVIIDKDSEDKLVDAATYAVESEFFIVEDITFVAKVADIVYTVVKQTKVATVGHTVFYFGLIDQYGEESSFVAPDEPTLEIGFKINGIVQELKTATENAGFIEIAITETLNENDELEFTFKGDEYKGNTIEYTVEAAGEVIGVGVVTRSEDLTLKASEVSIAAGEKITFSAIGFDIYGAPVPLTAENTANIIWTKDGTTISEADGITLSNNTLEYKFTTPGTYEIRVSWKDDTKIKQSLTVNVGMSKLSEVKIENIKSIDKDGKVETGTLPTIFSKNGKVDIVQVTGNESAAPLALDELEITVEDNEDEITAEDLNIERALSVDKKSVIISIAPTKVGEFKLKVVATRDDVEVNATTGDIEVVQVTTVAAITLATQATEDVPSVEVADGDTLKLKTTNELVLEMVLFNKHGEEITEDKLVDADNFSILSKTHGVEHDKLTIESVNGEAVTSGAIVYTITAKLAEGLGKDAIFEVKFNIDDVEDYLFNVDAYLPKLDSMSVLTNIEDKNAIVADETPADTRYNAVVFYDQDEDVYTDVKASQLDIEILKDGVKVTEENKGLVVTKYSEVKIDYKAITLGAVWVDTVDTATSKTSNDTDPVVAISVAPGASASGTYTVKLTLKEDETTTITEQEFTVEVGEARVVDSIRILTEEDVINLTDGAKATITFELLDQYGKVVTGDESTNMSAKLGDNDFTTDGGILAYDKDVYSITLTGGDSGNVKTGANGNLVVKYEDAGKEISVTSAAIKVNYAEAAAIKSINILATTTVNSNATTTISGIDFVVNAAKDVTLTATTLDKDGKEIKWADGKPENLLWEVVEAKTAEGETMVTTGFNFTESTELVTQLELKDLPNYTVKVKVSVTDGETTPTVYDSKEITLNVDNNVNLLADKVVVKEFEAEDDAQEIKDEEENVDFIEVVVGKSFTLVLNSEDQFGNEAEAKLLMIDEEVKAEVGTLVITKVEKSKVIESVEISEETDEENHLIVTASENYAGTTTLKITFLDANGDEATKEYEVKVVQELTDLDA